MRVLGIHIYLDPIVNRVFRFFEILVGNFRSVLSKCCLKKLCRQYAQSNFFELSHEPLYLSFFNMWLEHSLNPMAFDHIQNALRCWKRYVIFALLDHWFLVKSCINDFFFLRINGEEKFLYIGFSGYCYMFKITNNSQKWFFKEMSSIRTIL